MNVDVGTALEEVVEPREARTRARPPAPLIVGALAVSGVTVLPVVYLVIRALGPGAGSALATITEPRSLELLVRTVALTIAVTMSALAIGVPVAWLTTRTDLPARRTITVLTVLPLAIPTYVAGYAFVAAFGPRGLLRDALAGLGVERLPELYGFPGAWIVLTLSTYPYVLLTVRAAVRNLDPSIEEAARSLGEPPRRVLRRVVLPQLRPSIAAGGLLVALYTLHDLGAVALLRYDTLTRAIYTAYQGSFDRSRAATLALLLLAVIATVLWLEGRTRGRAAYHRAHGAAPRPAPVSVLGRRRAPALAACIALIVVGVAVPVVVIGTWLLRANGTGAIGAPLARSAGVAALTAAVAVVAAWPVAVLGARFASRFARWTERASFVGFALPGIVVALALVFIGIRIAPWLYQSLTMLVIAYVVLFLPQAGGALRASLLQVSPSLEEVARSLGAGPARRLRRIVAPLVRPGAVAGAGLVFLTTVKELPATLLLAPTGFRTLATEVWSAADAARFDLAAAPALALISIAAVGSLVILRMEGTAR